MSARIPAGLIETLTLLQEGITDAHACLDACHDRIAAREPQVGAWQWLCPRDACHRWLDDNADWLTGTPLRGLPVAIKDIIDTADMPTTMGSGLYANRQPVDDAACVAALRAAGALIMGKTVTTEFAYFSPGKTANPRDLRCTPGGSSSGSAAAVADGMVPVALGSQTAASVIRPAAYCGIMGYVATRGLMSLRGVQPLAQSHDSLGVLGRNFEDIRLIADILAGPGTLQSTAEPLRGLHIMRIQGAAIGAVSADMEAAIDDVAAQLREAGATVTHLADEGRIKRLVDLHGAVMAFEAARNLAAEGTRPDALSPQFAGLLETGRAITLADYAAAQAEIAQLGQWLDVARTGSAAILAPAAPGSAPEGHAATGAPHMSRPWQALGLPVVSWPAGTDAQGRPLGAQLIGQRWHDGNLLGMGREITLLNL
ncbi:amidase [Primorskyibacter flagellatus]|uniref:amidase n=1 Tax=Primorskyibacter flagellatus TaxID=1387277 RepID=UPI003A8CCE38